MLKDSISKTMKWLTNCIHHLAGVRFGMYLTKVVMIFPITNIILNTPSTWAFVLSIFLLFKCFPSTNCLNHIVIFGRKIHHFSYHVSKQETSSHGAIVVGRYKHFALIIYEINIKSRKRWIEGKAKLHSNVAILSLMHLTN